MMTFLDFGVIKKERKRNQKHEALNNNKQYLKQKPREKENVEIQRYMCVFITSTFNKSPQNQTA